MRVRAAAHNRHGVGLPDWTPLRCAPRPRRSSPRVASRPGEGSTGRQAASLGSGQGGGPSRGAKRFLLRRGISCSVADFEPIVTCGKPLGDGTGRPNTAAELDILPDGVPASRPCKVSLEQFTRLRR